ncbi:MAG: ABC transporter ATP-binding protein [Chloroflexi bacterium]|nr:MAG: ABC transporter ATP-binding protein [Chloroflexota bacterium]RLC82272.1 MAG: ABC transporter ATP-binding protein [Chloroflexota bacterium]
MTLLQVKDLTVEYHTDAGIFRAVEHLNFRLEQGKSLGLVGESGCGKTTAVLAMMRLLPEAGRIVGGEARLDGTDLLRLSPTEMREYRWHKISMVFQGAMNALNPVRTVGSQIEEPLLLHETTPRNRAKEEVARLLDLVGVSPSRANQYPHQFSGGMRQRAMIAMALACRPRVVITDEPTTALDVMIQAQILDLLQELQAELNLSIIMVTHDLGVVAELCDDVLVMYGGRMAECADADTIFNQPAHPYTRRLLLAFPDINDPRAELASIPGFPPPLDNLPPGCRFEPRCDAATAACAHEIPVDVEVAPGHRASCLLARPRKG